MNRHASKVNREQIWQYALDSNLWRWCWEGWGWRNRSSSISPCGRLPDTPHVLFSLQSAVLWLGQDGPGTRRCPDHICQIAQDSLPGSSHHVLPHTTTPEPTLIWMGMGTECIHHGIIYRGIYSYAVFRCAIIASSCYTICGPQRNCSLWRHARTSTGHRTRKAKNSPSVACNSTHCENAPAIPFTELLVAFSILPSWNSHDMRAHNKTCGKNICTCAHACVHVRVRVTSALS